MAFVQRFTRGDEGFPLEEAQIKVSVSCGTSTDSVTRNIRRLKRSGAAKAGGVNLTSIISSCRTLIFRKARNGKLCSLAGS
jgi:hypothetical protein